MCRFVKNIISVVYSMLRLLAMKVLHRNNLHCGIIQRISPNVVIELDRESKLSLGRTLSIHSGTKINVRNDAQLILGNQV